MTYFTKKIFRLLSLFSLACLLGVLAIGCAKKDSLNPDENLADADLFDGLKSDGGNASAESQEDLDKLVPAEDEEKSSEYAGDNLVKDHSAGENRAQKNYDYYYTAVGGETLGRVAYAIYNNRSSVKRILAMNPELRGVKSIPANTKISFDMGKASPRPEFLTKDMIERYKAELVDRIRARRLKSSGNEELAKTEVGRGETLQSISLRLYGTTRLWTEIFLVNQDRLPTYDQLRVGMTLKYFPIPDYVPAPRMAKAEPKFSEDSAVDATVRGSVSEQAMSAESDYSPLPAQTETAAMREQPAESNSATSLPEEVKAPSEISASADTPSAVPKPAEGDPGGSPPVVTGGIPVDPSQDLAATSPANGAQEAAADPAPAAPKVQKQIRPPAVLDPEILGEEEGFFSQNLRRIIYVGFIVLIIVGGYFLTRQPQGFKRSKFSGIQPMPGPSSPPPGSRPTVAPPINSGRVFVNRSGTPPPAGRPPGNNDQKTG